MAARGPPPAQCLRGMLGRLSHGPEGRGGRGGADGAMGAVLGRAAGPPNCFLTVQGGLPSREQPPIPGKSCRHVHPGQLGSGAFPLHCLKELSGVNMEKASWVRAGGGRLTPQEVRPGLGRCGSPCHCPGRGLSSPRPRDPLLCRDIEGVLPPAWGLCARMAYRQGLTGEGQRHFRGLRGPHCSQKAGALPVRHPHRAAATLGFHLGRLWG